mmetsp:Transcript_104224/g.300446  ORF Transcript_104224/g.300446 Transcript_104224/m.300446 type:complete len:96 (-) Transcript_104224:1775-2062(-)
MGSWSVKHKLEAATIPTALPTEIAMIDFSYGGYTGTIPTELGRCTKVTFMSLGGNKLTCAIPTQLGQAGSGSWTRASSKRGQRRRSSGRAQPDEL